MVLGKKECLYCSVVHYAASAIVSDVVFYQVTEHKVCWIRPDVLVFGQSEMYLLALLAPPHLG